MKFKLLLLFTFFFIVLLSGSFAWWNEDYTYRALITITDNNPQGVTDTNNVVRMPIDTATLIGAGKMLNNCDDLKIVFNDVTELDRNVVACNSADTNVWFMLNNAINGSDSSNYYVYYGNGSAVSPSDANLTIPGQDKFGFGFTKTTLFESFDDNTFGTWTGNEVYMTTAVDGTADANFNGTGGIVFTSGAFDFNRATFTIEMWIKPAITMNGSLGGSPSKPKNSCFFCYGYDTTMVQLRYDVDTCVAAGGSGAGGIFFYSNNSAASVCGTYTLAAGTWYHIAAVYDGTYKRIFVNGIQIAEVANNKNPTYAADEGACIGSDINPSKNGCVTNTTEYTFYGQIDSLKISQVARTRFPQSAINSESLHPTTSIGSEETNVNFIAAFTNTEPDILDEDEGIPSTTIDLNDTTNYINESTPSWTWIINDTNYSYDENTTKTFTAGGDYNVCLFVYLEDLNKSTACKSIEVQEYPQDLNFTWTPGVSVSIQVDFNATASDDENITTWAWDFGDQGTSSDQNATHTFTTGGNKNVCLTVTDYDSLQKQLCATVAVGGALTFHFYDENTHQVLTPNVLFNNTSYDVNTDGVLAIGLGGITTATYQIIAWDTNYSKRIWEFDLNSGSNLDYNVIMLKDQIGQAQDVNFLFYDENGLNILSNQYIYVYIGTGVDKNYAGIRKTNASGETYFYLNAADNNYTFVIGNLEYVPIAVTVLRPKDEVTKSIIATHDLDYWNIYTDTRTALTANDLFYLFPDTYNCQYIDVNADTYYPRTYCLKEKGNPKTKTFQPYLSAINDSILSWIYTFNKYDNGLLPGVLIRVFKTIPGEGRVEVQSKETDSSGAVTFSFITLDPYELEFYYDNELVYTANLNPSLTSYKVMLDLESWITTVPETYAVDVTFYPKENPIYPDDSNKLHFNFYIACSSSLGENPTYVAYEVTQWDKNLTPTSHVITSGIACDQNILSTDLLINMSDLNGTNWPVKASIVIIYGNGYYSKQYSWFAEYRSDYPGLIADLISLKADLLGDFGAAIIVVIICILIGAFLVMETPLASGAIGFVICAAMAFFAYIQWIPWTIFIVSCLFALGAYLLGMRRD